jgi:hypothetical protein
MQYGSDFVDVINYLFHVNVEELNGDSYILRSKAQQFHNIYRLPLIVSNSIFFNSIMILRLREEEFAQVG